MKKLSVALVFIFTFLTLPQATAAGSIIRVIAPAHQSYTGEFRNDDLVQQLTPSGRLGKLVFRPIQTNQTWVIDPALVDEVIAMTTTYTLANGAEPSGIDIAFDWLVQLKKATADNQVIALAYGNPDVRLAQQLAPSELRSYYSYGKERLQFALGRDVRSEPDGGWSVGSSGLSNVLRKSYSDNRKALTKLSQVVDSRDLVMMRARLGQLLSPSLNKDSRNYFSYNASKAVKDVVDKLRINSGNYQITTSSVKLPVTVINEFNVDVTINVSMVPVSTRVRVGSFEDVLIPAGSKRQLEMVVDVVAPGQTVVAATITDSEGDEVVPPALLTLNSTVIDPKVTWFTTGAAILLLLAAVAQSVRRVRRRGK
jgi:hypothetical protein